MPCTYTIMKSLLGRTKPSTTGHVLDIADLNDFIVTQHGFSQQLLRYMFSQVFGITRSFRRPACSEWIQNCFRHGSDRFMCCEIFRSLQCRRPVTKLLWCIIHSKNRSVNERFDVACAQFYNEAFCSELDRLRMDLQQSNIAKYANTRQCPNGRNCSKTACLDIFSRLCCFKKAMICSQCTVILPKFCNCLAASIVQKFLYLSTQICSKV